MEEIKIQSFKKFNEKRVRDDKNITLHMDRYGYRQVFEYEYNTYDKRKPKQEAIDVAKALGVDDVVYRITSHAYGQKWLVVYAKKIGGDVKNEKR